VIALFWILCHHGAAFLPGEAWLFHPGYRKEGKSFDPQIPPDLVGYRPDVAECRSHLAFPWQTSSLGTTGCYAEAIIPAG
jgi:hypothetical protein